MLCTGVWVGLLDASWYKESLLDGTAVSV